MLSKMVLISEPDDILFVLAEFPHYNASNIQQKDLSKFKVTELLKSLIHVLIYYDDSTTAACRGDKIPKFTETYKILLFT